MSTFTLVSMFMSYVFFILFLAEYNEKSIIGMKMMSIFFVLFVLLSFYFGGF